MPEFKWLEGRPRQIGKSFRELYLGEWDVSEGAVFTREQVIKLLEKNEITEQQAHEMLKMEYDTRIKKQG